MKRLLIATGVFALLALIVVASLKGGRRETGKKVYTQTVERRDLDKVVKASGELDARVRVNLSAHVIAKIEKLFVVEGQEVTAGQPFLELEKQFYLAARDSWQAQLRQTRTAVRQAEVDLADAQVRLDRARRLNQDGVLPLQDLEAAQLRRESAALALEQRQQEVLSAQANFDKARDELGKTTLYAPISGRVTELNAEAGEVVVSGTMNNPASVIATIADLSEILAEISVDENDIVDVALGQVVLLKVDALTDREYRGKVVEIGSSGFNRPNQPDVTFFRVKVLLEGVDAALRPGMSVRAEIAVAEHDQTVAVPISAVVERPAAGDKAEKAETGDKDERVKVVYLVENGKVARREVKTGLSNITHVEITTGLEPGAAVVVGPYRTLRDLRDGDAVYIGSEAEDRAKKKEESSNSDDRAEEEDR